MKPIKTLTLMALILISFSLVTKPAKATVNLDDEEKSFIQILNDYRKNMGRIELKPSNKLIESAEFYADDIANHPSSYNGEHVDSLGQHADDRGTHYNYFFLTENIERGEESGQAIFDKWKNSFAHLDNMIVKEARTVGIARAYNPDTEYKWYWVAVFSDEGVEEHKGNQLALGDLYNSSEYDYKKMSVTVKKKGKNNKQAEIKVYEVTKKKAKKNKKSKITKIRMVDGDITDNNREASLYSIGSKLVQIEVYKNKGDKKPVKTKLVNWDKNLEINFKL